MSVVARIEGSPSTSTSPQSILSHLNDRILPRIRPYMERLRKQQRTRLAERRLREEQNRAYQQSARKDEERVLKARREEARRKEREEEKRVKAASIERTRQSAKAWRSWMRGVLEREAEPAEGAPGAATIAFRLGDGRRVLRRFGRDSKVERIYAFVECALEMDDGVRSGAFSSDEVACRALTPCDPQPLRRQGTSTSTLSSSRRPSPASSWRLMAQQASRRWEAWAGWRRPRVWSPRGSRSVARA